MKARHALVDGVVAGLLRAQPFRGGDGVAMEGAEECETGIEGHFFHPLRRGIVPARKHHACATTAFAAPALGAAIGRSRAQVREQRE